MRLISFVQHTRVKIHRGRLHADGRSRVCPRSPKSRAVANVAFPAHTQPAPLCVPFVERARHGTTPPVAFRPGFHSASCL